FSRTYTFVNDLLSEDEKNICRKVMKIRGEEMYQHLHPRHLWRPYGSHANRAWHFLGEVGIAFLGEIDGAENWVWFATNVFFNVYPVWSDDDGGWHEGVSYWSSYIGRFTWWADVMREAMEINAYDKPYFSKVGYYAMYLMPPGKVSGGFGDGANRYRASNLVQLMSQLAAQAGNEHWQWYVEQMGGPSAISGYIGFIRGALPKVKAKAPDDLPASKLFRGTGQAYLNTTLTSADEDVQVIFKSSPMGTQSHGNAGNNSFVLWVYGQRLLIRTGRYYNYGGPHHRDWMWSTRSVNNVTVNGKGQRKRNAGARGAIVAFKTTPSMDIVIGEAGQAYEPLLERFTRAIIFVKPELIVVYDRLEAREPSVYEYWLHTVNKISVENQHRIQVRNDDVVCDVDFLTPSGLSFKQTDQYDPNPIPRIKLREWHLTATTPEKTKQMEFVTLYRPHRLRDQVPDEAALEQIRGGYALKVKLSDGQFVALLPTADDVTLKAHGLQSTGTIKCRLNRDSEQAEILELNE
ncbi:MAG: heparinase II/III family protein, partial [Planctomycetota bacterium]